jgi:hypothetical protein
MNQRSAIGIGVIDQLKLIAPVTAVSGNVDNDEQSGFSSEALIEYAIWQYHEDRLA